METRIRLHYLYCLHDKELRPCGSFGTWEEAEDLVENWEIATRNTEGNIYIHSIAKISLLERKGEHNG